MKIVTIVGARPQFVKAGVISRLLQSEQLIKEVIIHTGQHFDHNMSSVFFEDMEIPEPNYNLNINNLSHGAMTGEMLKEIEIILLDEAPDYVLVYGDTNSTLAGALAAKKIHLKVIHIEAGLRSNNIKMPEEVNRILTDRISSLLFCPTKKSIQNLTNEGFPFQGSQIVLSGDIMCDAALYYSKYSAEKSDIMEMYELEKKKFLLCTIHREENTNDLNQLRNIFKALDLLSNQYEIICPLHPRTQKIIEKNSISTKVKIINPVGYFDMIELLKNCSVVVTDSGGLQKEAFFFKKYCITLRAETEWVELVENNVNFLVGSSLEEIPSIVKNLPSDISSFNFSPYGSGSAGSIIIEEIKKDFQSGIQ